MEYWNVTTEMSWTSNFSSDNDLYFFIVIINEFFKNPKRVNWLKIFFFFSHNQFFVKMSFFAILILFNNYFNKIISSIFTSKTTNWFTEFIIKTSKLVSKPTRNVILILFWVRTFITFNISKLHSKPAKILNLAGIYLK